MNARDIQIALSPGEFLPAYLARAAQPFGAVVLLQEIFGVNANMRELADDYAARGFDAVVPDLFWRQEPGVQLDPGSAADRERAAELMHGLDTNLAVTDAVAAARHLRTLVGVPRKVGAVGYCLGGKLAYLLAGDKEIDAAVSYYGVGIHAALDKAEAVCCPLLVHIAEADHLCPPPAQESIKGALGRNPRVVVVSHPGVGHAFARRGGAGYDAEAARRADEATAVFLASAFTPAA